MLYFYFNIRDTSLDDFSGKFCCQGKFPLIKSVVDVFTGHKSTIDNECCGTPATSITTTPTKPTTTSTLSLIYVGCSSGDSIVPHATDCTKYIRCIKSADNSDITEVVEQCPWGYKFNPWKKECDW